MEKVQIVRDKESCAPPSAQRTPSREAQDRDGFLKKPQSPIGSRSREAQAAWPEE
jgi:hypothetical protein